MDASPDPCPVCGGREWAIGYVRTDDGEMRVDSCARCGWPPPYPVSVEEWREKYLPEAIAREERMVYASIAGENFKVILVADPEAEDVPDQRWHAFVDLAIAKLRQEVRTSPLAPEPSDAARSRRVSLDLGDDARMDVSIPPCCELDDRTLAALREIGEATIQKMREREQEATGAVQASPRASASLDDPDAFFSPGGIMPPLELPWMAEQLAEYEARPWYRKLADRLERADVAGRVALAWRILRTGDCGHDDACCWCDDDE